MSPKLWSVLGDINLLGELTPRQRGADVGLPPVNILVKPSKLIYTSPMPCSDSSSSINIKTDHDERFISYQYAKITCGQEITGGTKYANYLTGKQLEDILNISYQTAVTDLGLTTEEEQYILYMEWDALRSAIGLYLGVDHPEIDIHRCMITSIEASEEGIEIAEVILPPKEMPKILPCSLADQRK